MASQPQLVLVRSPSQAQPFARNASDCKRTLLAFLLCTLPSLQQQHQHYYTLLEDPRSLTRWSALHTSSSLPSSRSARFSPLLYPFYRVMALPLNVSRIVVHQCILPLTLSSPQCTQGVLDSSLSVLVASSTSITSTRH